MLLNIRIKIILLVLSVPIMIYFWPTVLGGDSEILVVQGKSMLPTILPGSLIVTKQAPSYQIDDIVSFTQKEGRSQKIVVHRIIDETERGFIIKGDNNAKKDAGYPTEEDIRGKVIFWVPYVGDVLGSLRDPVVLIVTGLVLGVFQVEQKRRKNRKEKLKRIRLGISEKAHALERKLKKKKPDYSMFFVAIGFNILTYLAIQVSIGSRIKPQGDALTGFIFNIFEYSFASTLVFGLWFLFIIGLYFMVKLYEARTLRKLSNSGKKSKVLLVQAKGSNSVLAAAQFLWFLFILLSLFHILAIANDLASVFS